VRRPPGTRHDRPAHDRALREGAHEPALAPARGGRRVHRLGDRRARDDDRRRRGRAARDAGRDGAPAADPRHAGFARRHIAASPYADRVDVHEGPALDTLARLTGPFDFVFIDADKPSYIRFLDATLPLLSGHGVIAVDNALHFAITADADDAAAIEAFNAHVAGRADLIQVVLTVRAGLMLIRRAP
jgi:predicted O-methyltransferase YrrM